MHMLDSAIPTMAHAMGAAGYRPVQVGRLHFNGPDQLHGYAERFVGDHGPNYAGGAPVDHGSLAGTTGPHRVSLQASGHGQSAYEVHDEHVIRSAVDLIDSMGSSKSAGEQAEPFSLSLGLMLPHQPYVARKPDYDQYRGTVPMPSRPEPFGRCDSPIPEVVARTVRHRRSYPRRGAKGANGILGARHADGRHDRRGAGRAGA